MARLRPTWDRPLGRLLVLGGAAAIAAVLVAGQTYLSMLHHGHDWWRLFLWQLVSWSFWAALAPWLIRRGQAQRSEPWRRWLSINLLLCVLLGAAHIALSAAAMAWLQPYLPVEQTSFAGAVSNLQRPWAVIDVLLFWLLIVSGNVYASRRQARELEMRESRLETELAKAQLEALRLKMQPHFLFNTLNSIAALIRKRANDQALEMVVGLGELLRLSLDRSEDQLVPLREEVDFVERYVELHLQRFADRLNYRQEVAPESLDLEVPSLILQPLVENSIRHAISRSPAGGTVTLRVDPVAGGELRVRVEDDGPGLPEGFSIESCRGVGLSGIRSRLAQLYGGRARLTLSARPEGGTVAELRLPAAGPPHPGATP